MNEKKIGKRKRDNTHILLILLFLFGALAQASSLTSTSTYTNPDGLIAYWDFAQCTGTSATDRGDWGLTGTIYGGVNATWVIGKYGCGINFAGLNAYIDGTNNSILQFGTGSFTISIWAKPSATNSDMRIVQKFDASSTQPFYSLGVGSDNKPFFYVRDSGGNSAYATSSDTITTGTWYHLAGVWDSSTHTAYIYINGVQKGSTNNNNVANTNNVATLKIGRSDYTGGTSYFNGVIDEPKIWNNAKTAQEIYIDYLGTYANIEAYYQMLSTSNITAVGTNLTIFNQSTNNTLNNLANNMSIFNSSTNGTLNSMATNISQLTVMQQSGNNNITLVLGNQTDILGNMSGNYSYFDLLINEILGNATSITIVVNNTNTTIGGSNTTFNYTMPFNLTEDMAKQIAKANWRVQYEQELQGYESTLEANQRLALYMSITILVLLLCISGYIVYYVVRRKRT
jgi:hypothetical protein